MLKEANEDLKRLSTTDALTGIANRRSFDEYLEREWGRTMRSKEPLTLIMCDIDFFKNYNDLHGHQQGDICLQAVARTIREKLERSVDFAARYGGEEFAVILPDTSASGGRHVAETIRNAVRARALPHGNSSIDQYVTLSLGVATAVPQAGSSAYDLLHTADEALYKAKEQGRNRTIVSE